MPIIQRANSRSAETRSHVQKPPHKDLEATYVPVSNRACERSAKTRSLAQQPACKNLDRNDQSPVITVKAAYTSVTERANSRSVKISLALLA